MPTGSAQGWNCSCRRHLLVSVFLQPLVLLHFPPSDLTQGPPNMPMHPFAEVESSAGVSKVDSTYYRILPPPPSTPTPHFLIARNVCTCAVEGCLLTWRIGVSPVLHFSRASFPSAPAVNPSLETSGYTDSSWLIQVALCLLSESPRGTSGCHLGRANVGWMLMWHGLSPGCALCSRRTLP